MQSSAIRRTLKREDGSGVFAMTRVQLLKLLVQRARERGFNFRKWFAASAAAPWTDADEAIAWLSRGNRASVLLFSHSFAQSFWHSGERVTFLVPHQTYQRVTATGDTRTIERKAHRRRSSREDVWQFHLREMAAASEPLRYIRRYLIVQEVVDAASEDSETVDAAETEGDDSELLVREESVAKGAKKVAKKAK